MDLTFTRTGERTYAVMVHRDDGVTYELRTFDRTCSLPHDITHFVVERELGLERGLWGSIAAGAVFENMRLVSGRRPPHAAERSRSVIKEVDAEAEVLVSRLFAIYEKRLEDNWPAASRLLNDGWQPRRSFRPPVTAEEVRQTCKGLCEAQQQWGALPIGESMTVSWLPRGRSKTVARRRSNSLAKPNRKML